MPALLDSAPWANLSAVQLAIIALLFVWSGFVRSGLGFGGAALTLPLLLIVLDEPIVFLPAIALQLLVFSSLTIAGRTARVDWAWLARIAAWLLLPFVAGLIGLLRLPGSVLSLFVYAITLAYGVLYCLDRPLTSRSRRGDVVLIALGGYASGVSLTGAPLIAAVASRHLPVERVRDTLFVLWIGLVLAKLSTFLAAGVDLQIALFLTTLPFAALGHVLGLRAHRRLLQGDRRAFQRVLGVGLAAVSLFGIASIAAAMAGR